MTVIDELYDIFQRYGARAYSEEAVTQTAHMLQTAAAAERAGADRSLVAASLLHDVGHFLHAHGHDAANRGIDGRHEDAAAVYLAEHFGPEVTEPIRLHVAAKRYLCATKDGYFDRLSPGSVRSLNVQGGPMSEAECEDFRANPYYRDAVRLRAWDEAAKVPGALTPDLDHYRPVLESLVRD